MHTPFLHAERARSGVVRGLLAAAPLSAALWAAILVYVGVIH